MNKMVSPFPALRAPPSNLQAEQGLLGALLSNNKAVDRVAEFLEPRHFFDPLNGRIYEAVLEHVAAGRPADAVTLLAQFEHDQDAMAAGGAGYLAALLTAMVGILNAGEYGRAIRDAWTRRELIEICEVVYNKCFAGDPVGEVIEALDASLLRVAEGAGDELPVVHFAEAVAQQLMLTEAAMKRDTPLAGITTGYAALDRMLLGMQPGKLMLLAARPSMGKTALALGIAVRAAMSGARGLFWSGEMSAPQLGARAAAAYAGLSTTSVFSGRNWGVPPDAHGRPERLGDRDWSRLIAAERAARTLPLVFDTRPGVTVQALRSRARRMKRAKGLDFVVIDYVGLMRASGGAQPRSLYEKITGISAELMEMKAELNVPVLAMVQLNRANEAREDKAPAMSDLRDSGALEQDADVVMLLHRPHYYLSRNEVTRRGNETDEAYHNRCSAHAAQTEAEQGRATVLIAKNRQGAAGPTRLLFHDETTWFRDTGEGPDAPAWSGTL